MYVYEISKQLVFFYYGIMQTLWMINFAPVSNAAALISRISLGDSVPSVLST